jgi:hypothetical protein
VPRAVAIRQAINSICFCVLVAASGAFDHLVIARLAQPISMILSAYVNIRGLHWVHFGLYV